MELSNVHFVHRDYLDVAILEAVPGLSLRVHRGVKMSTMHT